MAFWENGDLSKRKAFFFFFFTIQEWKQSYQRGHGVARSWSGNGCNTKVGLGVLLNIMTQDASTRQGSSVAMMDPDKSKITL